MRKMGGEKIQSVAGFLLPKHELETLELTQSQFTSSIIRAQKQMEGWNFSIRKHLFDYDSVINRQRQRIYTKRDEMLSKVSYNYIILHGFEGRPDGNFKPWLKRELEARGGVVTIPALPNPDMPDIEEQINFIATNAQFNHNTILVGHSLGVAVALKALERKGVKIKKLVLMAGFAEPKLHTDELDAYFPSFDWTFDFAKIRSLAEEIVVIHDNKDTVVPREQAELLAKELHVKPVFVDAEEEHFDAKEEPSMLPYIAVDASKDNTTVEEVRSFIADIVDGLIRKYENTQMEMAEVIETIKQDFAFEELPLHDVKVRSLSGLRDALVSAFDAYFDKKLGGVDPRMAEETLRMIYLAMIDKYWIAHIDDMQYLRDKVGLYGYAQQDPLIIYKKEAFDKFEQLMFNIKQETIAIIFRTDFRAGQGQTIVNTEAQQSHAMLDRLQEASQDVPEFTPYAKRQAQPMPQNYQQAKQQQYANAFKDDDGVEVIQTTTHSSQSTMTGGKKYGRNDMVTVISPDGKEEEMKYKKAEELLTKGRHIK